jgi:cytochrome b
MGPGLRVYACIAPSGDVPLNNKATDIRAALPPHPAMIWDLLIRISGWGLFMLLIAAYVTGEEFQHTHLLIGYAIAVLVVASIFWMLIRPHSARFPGFALSPRTITALLQNVSSTAQPHATRMPTLGVAFICVILTVLALCAVIIMLITHTLWV